MLQRMRGDAADVFFEIASLCSTLRPFTPTPAVTLLPGHRFVRLEVARDIMEASGRTSEVPVDEQAPQVRLTLIVRCRRAR
jgi:hypothetical protein